MEFKDYYQTLGVAKTASADEIKKAFRKLARASHPDLHPGDKAAEARFKDINEAYEVLGDPDKRRKYDELGANWRTYEQAAQSGGAPFGQPWAGFGGGGRPTYRTVSADELRDLFGTDDPFSDFFHTFFGGQPPGDVRKARGAGRARRGQDVEHPVELTLEEAFTGTSRRLRLSFDGAERTVDVRIPAGVRDGTRVRAAGEGARGEGGGTSGDLFLAVHLLPHARFERKGQDLHTRVSVPVTAAVLGGETEVVTLSGGTLRLKVPPMSQAGRVFRLKGHGMPSPANPGARGDLYATLEVRIPPSLSPEARAHYEALRALEGQSS
jgi:DnaJ-class molecular chaperone